MRAQFDGTRHPRSQRLADLRDEAAECERRALDARRRLEHELAAPAPAPSRRRTAPAPDIPPDYWTADDWATSELASGDWHEGDWHPGDWDHCDWEPADRAAQRDAAEEVTGHGGASDRRAAAVPARAPGARDAAGHGDEDAPAEYAATFRSAADRTDLLVSQGRRSTYYRGLSRKQKCAVATAAACAVITIVAMLLSGGSASWPASVAVMQNEADKACLNPDVRSEPGQVNFACAKSTRQILWVFALLTSGGDAGYANPRTGRIGLEPISRTQGGALAWSLNLHHPYDPASPVDSMAVAARAINNIIGGATVTSASGTPVVQEGLEGNSANCLRYTGSAALTTRSGFPSLCASPVSSPSGQAALVADVYRRWVVGAKPQAAQDAAVLFANATNPGDPQVQAILRRLPTHG